MPDEPVDDRRRDPGYPGEESVPARPDGGVERVAATGEAQHLRDVRQVEQLRRIEATQCSLDRRGVLAAVACGLDVVPDHELAVGVDAAGELVELQREEAAVGAELDDVPGDLLGDASHHVEALDDGRDVPDGHEVLDLERGQGAGDLVES